jgi:3,4-dihydroxy 2-butanone 4-phosphate synthase/GTP cyclohydrolase II
MPLASIPEAIEDIREGRFVIVVDDEDRENEGDLTVAADKITAEHVNFMATHGRGLICMPCAGWRLDELSIGPMVPDNTAPLGTAFCVSIEARTGVASGISAFDRAETVRRVVSPDAKPHDFVKPGHTFPLRARDGGVLVRAGQTEAAVDLARMAGLFPCGVICEIMNEDGTMSRMPDLEVFSRHHGIRIITIRDLIAYRRRTERLVRRVASTHIPTDDGTWQAFGYEDIINKETHLALVYGEIDPARPVLLRVHSECLTGDIFGSRRCDCGEQLRRAIDMITEEGAGVILYLRQEGRGLGLLNKLRAYELQDTGLDTVEANHKLGFPADDRDYGIGCQILYDLGVRKLRVLSNNPRKYYGLEGYGLEFTERVPLVIEPNVHNERYLATKAEKLGHLLG